MLGSEVYKYATRQMGESALAALRNAGLTVDDVDQFVFHQANLRIIESVQKQFGIPARQDVREHREVRQHERRIGADGAGRGDRAAGGIKPGDRILMVAFGAGYTAGAAVVEWTADPRAPHPRARAQTRHGPAASASRSADRGRRRCST